MFTIKAYRGSGHHVMSVHEYDVEKNHRGNWTVSGKFPDGSWDHVEAMPGHHIYIENAAGKTIEHISGDTDDTPRPVEAVMRCMKSGSEDGGVKLECIAEQDAGLGQEYARFFEATPYGECFMSVMNEQASSQFIEGELYRVRFEHE